MKKIFSCICVLICLWNTNTLAEAKCDTYIMGKCFSCHSPMTFEISSDEICQMICPERIVIHSWKSSFCALSKCPKSYPYRDEKTGDCRLSQQTPMDIELNKINIEEHASLQWGLLVFIVNHTIYEGKSCYDHHDVNVGWSKCFSLSLSAWKNLIDTTNLSIRVSLN